MIRRMPGPRSRANEEAFERFYLGWDDFMQDRPRNPPAGWTLRERDLYFRGHSAAHAAAERFRAGARVRGAS